MCAENNKIYTSRKCRLFSLFYWFSYERNKLWEHTIGKLFLPSHQMYWRNTQCKYLWIWHISFNILSNKVENHCLEYETFYLFMVVMCFIIAARSSHDNHSYYYRNVKKTRRDFLIRFVAPFFSHPMRVPANCWRVSFSVS